MNNELEFVRSRKGPFSVIPANPGSGPGQAPESSIFKELQESWTPFFNGVTTFYETINSEPLKTGTHELL
jgi:hypothetical protein